MSRIATEQPRAVWCCSVCGAIYHRDFPRCPADGGEVVMTERDPLIGSAVGHYAIDRLVGEGGMGRVYLAHHLNLPNKRYAFKVLLGDHAASSQMRMRFTREAERASQLDHPNVVKVVDFGQTQSGLLYIAMDYVDGLSLVSLIGDVPMAPWRVVQLAREICKGLAYAHDAGIVHRDLKPENILVTRGPDGEVPRIVDFGLALSIDQSDARLTESGMTMGTPLFAAPEQLLGRAIDHRADLFALGMTMFEMLTGGMTAIDGHLMEVVSAKTTKDAPRVSERAPELMIPVELDDLVARLTRRKPEDRFADARAVIAALDKVPLGAARPLPGLPPMAVAVAGQIWPTGHVALPAPGLAAATADDAAVAEAAVASGDPTEPDPETRMSTAQIARRRGRWRRGLIALGAIAACGGAVAGWAMTRPEPVTSAPVVNAAVAAPVPTVVAAGSGMTSGLVADHQTVAAAAPPAVEDSSVAAAGSGTTSGLVADPQTVAAVAAEPAEIEMPGEPASQLPRHRHPRAARGAGPAPVAAAAPVVMASPAATDNDRAAARAATAAPLRTAAAPPIARELAARLQHVDVSGSLPAGAVERAIQRSWPAIAGCVPAAPTTVVAHFTIGEARRARDVRLSSVGTTTRACLSTAFGEVRTEAAPDVGDVEVTVRIAFVVKT